MTLTEREFWLNYWESKKDLIITVPKDFNLANFLVEICKKNTIKTSLELGGFPGHYSIYLKKWLGVTPTLLDYIIHYPIIEELLKVNQLSKNDINIIEADLFTYPVSKQYDLVFSNGLIEHFEDTKYILSFHHKFLVNNGHLYVTLPNFRGFNGWLQKTFDIENYNKHNIECMDIPFLKKCLEELGFSEIDVFYYGKFMMWLENYSQKNIVFRVIFKVVWFILKIFFKIIPVETKLFSPYIVILAKK